MAVFIDERPSEEYLIEKRLPSGEARPVSRIAPIPGFEEFISSDSRFPATISFPNYCRPVLSNLSTGHIAVYSDGSLAKNLRIDIEDLKISAQRNRDVQLLLEGQRNITPIMMQLISSLDEIALTERWRRYQRKPRTQEKIIGDTQRPIRTKRLIWLKPSEKPFGWLTSSREYGGEWVFFLRWQKRNVWFTSTTTFQSGAENPQLWVFKNAHTGDAQVSESDFHTFLSSFRLRRVE